MVTTRFVMERKTTFVFIVGSTLAWLAAVGAQIAVAQVVQLPSVHNFSYTGGALVPDGGTATLGGVGYGRSGSVSRGFGPLANRARGGRLAGSTASVSVQIIDLRALDDAILSANVPVKPGKSVLSADLPAANGGRRFLSTTGPERDRVGGLTVTEPGKWQRILSGTGSPKRQLSPSQAESDIRYYLRLGKEAEQANRILSARVYYRMAVEAMTPEMIVRYKAILAEREKQAKEKRKSDSATTGRKSF